jgi:soluble lytic murein transglycosylase-like protein
MMEEMYATMSRINEIRERFNLQQKKEPVVEVSAVKPESKSFASLVDANAVQQNLIQSSSQSHVRKNMTVDEINSLAETMAKKQGVSPSLVKAVIQNESGYDPDAVSPKGAMGLMQLMPQTAETLGVADPFSPEDNIRGGVKMLKDLLSAYKGDYTKAVAAYNAGKETVDKYNGTPPYKETQDYVKRVIDTVRSDNDQGE